MTTIRARAASVVHVVRSGTGRSDARFGIAMEDSRADRGTAGPLPNRAHRDRNHAMVASGCLPRDPHRFGSRWSDNRGSLRESSNISFEAEPRGHWR